MFNIQFIKGIVKRIVSFLYIQLLLVYYNLKQFISSIRKAFKSSKGQKNNHENVVLVNVYGNFKEINYSDWAMNKARKMSLRCLAYKTFSGYIKALIVGPDEDLKKFLIIMWKGPQKAKILKVEEHWVLFKNGSENNYELQTLKQSRDQWSRGTLDILKKTMVTLKPLLDQPNTFDYNLIIDNAGEIQSKVEKKNLFFTRFSNANYISSPEKVIGMQQSQSSHVTSIVRSITDHKHLAKELIALQDLNVPRGYYFNNYSLALNFFKENNMPVVLKPAAGSYGEGVTVDVQTAEDLENAWNFAEKYHHQVILEEQYYGADVRVLVIGGTARAALLRIPANIIGDGYSTIKELIESKNVKRSANPRLCKAPIIYDLQIKDFLRKQGFTINSVPPKGEIVFLRMKANIGAGADSVCIFQYINTDLLKVAEEAVKPFGVDDFWGVDLLLERIDQPRNKQNYAVIEVNSRANIFNVRFPSYGEPFDAAQALIDHLFPEDTSDAAYPVDSYRVSITGILDQEFILSASDQAKEMGLKGHLCAVNTSVEGVVSGRRHHVMFYMDWLLNYSSESGALVDGLQINRTAEIADNDFNIKAAVEAESETKSFSEQIAFKPDELPVNTFSSYTDQSLDLNLQLFIDEFKRHGYEARHLYEELIEIKKDNVTGITGMRHSSLFCDKVCEKLYPAKRILALNGLPVLRGVRFKSGKMKEALSYFEALSNVCILTNLHPNGYKTHIVKEQSELKRIWKKAREKGTGHFMVEEYIKGWHLCMAVVDGVAVSALGIERVHVDGDGQSSITELIEAKNSLRLQNPWYISNPINLDKHLLKRLDSAGFKPEDIPEEGQRIYLETETGLEYGGETVNMERFLAKGFETKAEEAVKAIPGLELAYVHMIAPCPDVSPDQQRWVVTGIDTRPEVGMFHFPWKGKSFNITERVVTDLCLTEKTKWQGGGGNYD